MDENLKGLCIKATDAKENDKVITLISFKYGKLVAYATGVRKPKAKLKMATMPLAYGNFSLFSNSAKKFNKLIGAQVEESFFNCWSDTNKHLSSHIILEILDKTIYFNQVVDSELALALRTISMINYTLVNSYVFALWFILQNFKFNGIDISTYENFINDSKTLFLLESIAKMDLDSLDSMELDQENVISMLHILANVYKSELGITLNSIFQINKALNFFSTSKLEINNE